ncbi:MAG TPA: glucose dehydrogenase [Planctomycetaceae bacterium]|jgi:glucose 1-dehydrogenase|nr:glucose dehydrogenase [Planctomycetaceae bacterium]
MPNLEGKVALVTGAGRGIGRGCAIALAQAGATLVINDRPGSADLPEAAQEIDALGATCFPIESDAFSRGGCEQLLSQAREHVEHIDILVSNPAWNTRCGFLDQDPEEFERVIQATLTAGFHISQLVARHMVDQGRGGKIVFISSVQAELPMAGNIGYGPAKAALNHMARSIAVELAQHRICVNAIEPGWIDTPGEHESFGSDLIQQEGTKLPLGRLGTPADIGHAAAFLCSDEADYITGSILAVDGGFRYKDFRPDTVLQPPPPQSST